MKFKAKVICSNKAKKEIEIDAVDRTTAISNLRKQGFLIYELSAQENEAPIPVIEKSTQYNKLAIDPWLRVNDHTRIEAKLPNFKYILFPVVILVFLYANGVITDLMPADITLHADPSGHYRGNVLINNVQMPFLIDTGATFTSIPEHMAIAAGLSFGKTIQMNTANGQTNNQLTFIDTLKIGNIEIRNIDAVIMNTPFS